MKLLLELSLRDLIRDWVYLLCNVAVLAGVIVPLLVLFGVRNGVYDALIGRLLSNPATLQIDTTGNNAFSESDIIEVRSWDNVQFATLKTRSLFDYVNVREKGGRGKQEAIISPSGTGDPMIAPLPELGEGEVVISDALADQLDLSVGAELQIFTQAPERPRQLMLPATVAGILPSDRVNGRVIMADIGMLDLVEAFYDEYALPDYGITKGKPLSSRNVEFEGMRLYAADLEDLGDLQNRVETRFGISTQARTAEVASVLGLGRNLGLALALTATVAATGLAAALIFGFWGEVARKRRTLANLGLLGLPPRLISLFPIVQAVITAVVGLVVSFLLLGIAAIVAERLFESGLSQSGGLVSVSLGQGVLISLIVLIFVTCASLVAARSAMRTDPATILREQT